MPPIEYWSLFIAALSVVAVIIFGILGARHNSSGDIEKRIQAAADTAAANARIDSKLSDISSDTKDIKSEMKSVKEEVNDMGKRLLIVEESTKSAHHRIDEIVQKGELKNEGN